MPHLINQSVQGFEVMVNEIQSLKEEMQEDKEVEVRRGR